MKKKVLFGAGSFGVKALKLIGKENVAFFIDNSSDKINEKYNELDIFSFEAVKEKLVDYKIVVTVSEQYEKQIVSQLKSNYINDFWTFDELPMELVREKIGQNTDFIDVYNKAICWILNHTVNGDAIINNTQLKKGYPEVTGYYIPTLMRWGYRDIALSFAKWLCSIQKPDGSWYDTYDMSPYVFDTAQILKGLLAIREVYPEVDEHIQKGCDWILSNIQESGRLTTPAYDEWGDNGECSELIHLYCLSPLIQAANVFDEPVYKEKALVVLNYYKKNHCDEIMDFGILSHFYAYIMEALVDLGEIEMVTLAMKKIEILQKNNGFVPAYKNVQWVCSTGLFQLSIVWYRLGNLESGKKAFDFACKLQNQSGGWYGSYVIADVKEENTYFPMSEISWASKYFLDALYYKNVAEFNAQAEVFLDKIGFDDGRYKVVKETIQIQLSGRNVLSVLDLGCGKGRYLKNLLNELPKNEYYAVDLSDEVMSYFLSESVIKKQGSLTQIPYKDDSFDIVYACESLEHAVDIKSAVMEMVRVTKSSGKIIIIDKNKKQLGRMEIEEWEQWLDEKEMVSILSRCCSDVVVNKEISYDDVLADGLFYAWIGTVEKAENEFK